MIAITNHRAVGTDQSRSQRPSDVPQEVSRTYTVGRIQGNGVSASVQRVFNPVHLSIHNSFHSTHRMVQCYPISRTEV